MPGDTPYRLRLPDGSIVDPGLLRERFVRSGGPGGQNVNKTSTQVELRLDLEACDAIPATVKARIAARHRGRLTAAGELRLTCQETRDQARNREIAYRRMQALVAEAWPEPVPRRPTRPRRGAQVRRLDTKRRHGVLKRERGAPLSEE